MKNNIVFLIIIVFLFFLSCSKKSNEISYDDETYIFISHTRTDENPTINSLIRN